jgi:hypothetical protein
MPRPPNTSRRLQPKTPHQVAYDLREQARSWCPAALQVVVKCLDDPDSRVRLTAASILFERSYGKAPVTADLNVNHNYVEVPAVLTEEQWLKQMQEMRAHKERLDRGDPSPHATPWLDQPIVDVDLPSKKPN